MVTLPPRTLRSVFPDNVIVAFAVTEALEYRVRTWSREGGESTQGYLPAARLGGERTNGRVGAVQLNDSIRVGNAVGQIRHLNRRVL